MQLHLPTFSEPRYAQGMALKALADALPHVVWVTDGAGRMIYCSRQYQDYTGSTLEGLKRLGIRPYLHSEDIQKTDKAWERSLSTGETYRTKYRLKNHKGEYRWQLAMAQPLRNESGQIERWFGTITDIHEERLHEESLLHSATRDAEALRLAKRGAWAWIHGSRFLEATDLFCKMMGFPRNPKTLDLNEVLQKIEVEDLEKFVRIVQKSRDEARDISFQFRLRNSAEKIQADCCWLGDSTGKAIRLVGTVIPIPEPNERQAREGFRRSPSESISTQNKEQLADSLENSPVFQGLRILIVDDSVDNQKLLRFFLKKAGAACEFASNGVECIDKALSGDFHIVLCDLHMPVMDGYTAVQKLRDLGYKKPIIALTANAMKGVREKCLQAGCSDHLAKPVSSQDLYQALLRHSNLA